MIFFTPDIGTFLKLEQDWTFTLFSEYRNRDLFNKLKQRYITVKFIRVFIFMYQKVISKICFQV